MYIIEVTRTSGTRRYATASLDRALQNAARYAQENDVKSIYVIKFVCFKSAGLFRQILKYTSK